MWTGSTGLGRQPVAPSRAEASCSSLGMDARPPMKSRNENPKFCHTYTSTTTAAAPPDVVSHGTAGMPMSESSQFTTPNCSLNR